MEKHLLTYKNITNLIANKITNYFEGIENKNLTQVWVTYVGRFYVVTGKTSVTTPVNIGSLINDYLSQFYGDEWQPVNILDLIDYGYSFEKERSITFTFDKYDNYFTSPFELAVGIKEDYNKPIVSDKIFGSSLYFEKAYFAHFAKIFNHLMSSSFCNEARITLHILPNEEPSFMMTSNNWIVTYQHAFNVVDATFSHDITNIITKMDLESFDFEDLIFHKDNYPWMKRDRIKDFTMI